MVECVCSCADFLVFLFGVVGFMPRTSCILILLFIVVCRGRGSFVSMWVVHRCASPQMLEVCFISSCFSNVHGSHHERVCHFRVSCFMFPPRSVSMCEHVLATRGKSLSEQFCCVKFPEHMVFMFSFGVDDYSSHSAKRCLFRNEA